MQSFPQPLSAAQEASYLRQYQNGDMHARDILIERNLRLVAHIVKKYIHSGKETDELISIGIIGLVKAVNTYNFDKSNRLATYAARCIDNELLMLMRGDKSVPGRSLSTILSELTRRATRSLFSALLNTTMKMLSNSWPANSLFKNCQRSSQRFSLPGNTLSLSGVMGSSVTLNPHSVNWPVS